MRTIKRTMTTRITTKLFKRWCLTTTKTQIDNMPHLPVSVRDYGLVSYTLYSRITTHNKSSLSCLFNTFTLTLVRRAASPSRKVSFTQKPVVYPPTFGYSAPPFVVPSFSRNFLLIKISAYH